MMREKLPLTLAAPAQHLHRLVMIRWLLFACLCAAAVLSVTVGHAHLPYFPVSIILGVFIGINWLTLMRLRQELPVTTTEFFVQILIDVACLSTLFYFSGGANNPFISYFLVPISISAATLAWRYTLFIALCCIVSYSTLLFFHIPLPALSPLHYHGELSDINPHIVGMWLNFFISAALITYFVVKMAEDLRRQNDLLNRRREDELRDEQLMAVATLAAGTAHELGTPLATMKILLAELSEEHRDQSQLLSDLNLLSDQVEQCALTLRQLVGKAELNKDGVLPLQDLRAFCDSIIERWRIMRPEVTSQVKFANTPVGVKCAFHPTITQSIINLLNNAADADPKNIAIEIWWDDKSLHWRIEDNGPGIPMEIANQLGTPFVTTKGKGLGLGLFLTHASINRYGGKICLYNRHPRGTLTELILPFSTS